MGWHLFVKLDPCNELISNEGIDVGGDAIVGLQLLKYCDCVLGSGSWVD